MELRAHGLSLPRQAIAGYQADNLAGHRFHKAMAHSVRRRAAVGSAYADSGAIGRRIVAAIELIPAASFECKDLTFTDSHFDLQGFNYWGILAGRMGIARDIWVILLRITAKRTFISRNKCKNKAGID
jgi:hypothetical protein